MNPIDDAQIEKHKRALEAVEVSRRKVAEAINATGHAIATHRAAPQRRTSRHW